MGRTIHIYGFPCDIVAQDAKSFLEIDIGLGVGVVVALKIRQAKTSGWIQKAYAVVQFTEAKIAKHVSFLADENQLRYGNIYGLKVRKVERDIVPKPKAVVLNPDIVTLHFGCQVSSDKVYVLWKGVDVAANFSFFGKFVFLLSQGCMDYKLEIPYSSIWQIQLRRSPRENKKFLLIQVFAAPRIYEKSRGISGNKDEESSLNYFRDAKNDLWVRTTDFTPSFCIGQSSVLCLELPYSSKLPNICQTFHYYKEAEGQFSLETGSTFSGDMLLVPIVGPPQGIGLPYNILFMVNTLIQAGCLAAPTLGADFYRLVHPNSEPVAHIERALEKLYHLKDCCYEPVQWLNEEYAKYRKSKPFSRPSAVSRKDNLVYIRRVQITPSKVYFISPEVIVSNRVLRNYHKVIDNFIRVSFVDEGGEKLRSTYLSPRRCSANEEKKLTAIYRRILSVLQIGIVIGDKKFEFLAFSSSQLRDNSVWMFASQNGLSSATIRQWMGDFHEIRNVAKHASRLGQSFSSSKEALTVNRKEIEIIPDVEIESDGTKYIFSDGIGKISLDFARKVAKKCGIKGSIPSAFQIRYGGYKGVVSIDPTSRMKLSLRKSMLKYTSENAKLDVLSMSKNQPCYLNRQLITLLSTLGVEDHVFEKKQKEVVDQLDKILTDPLRAKEALELMSPGESTNVLQEMLSCGYRPDAEPFLAMMLQAFRTTKLLELRNKSRIPVPNGRSMMGCLDETKTLEYGQVFVQVSRKDGKEFLYDGHEAQKSTFIVKGKVVVAKNPCLHPGDVRVLQAVNVPSLHHLVDCVVFPQKGTRPHPNECSGSDLDGDIYFISWDSELIPPRQIQPMDYTPAPIVHLDHDVKIEEVQEYFVNYMVNDSLGIIANAHIAFADREPLMAESGACIELARLFSIAVDFPKTGVPAEIPPHLVVKEYPDFMEKLDRPTYESTHVIGKLFRAVKDVAPQTSNISSFTWEVAKRCYDYDMEVDGFEYYLDSASAYKEKYDFKMGNLMDYYGIKTEAEILGRCVIHMSKSYDKKKDGDAVGLAVKSLRKKARSWFAEGREEDAFAKASAWYHVTYHPNYWGSYNEGMKRDHFLSFPWCVCDKLIQIKEKNKNRKGRNEDSLCKPFHAEFEV
ncbi:hypothetical protein GIB67_006160 [Kingdonia uniflora]|uniref:RNA-dependent RNA polymerase n=1 Tax=Kingdonia uniflora TaxID=39325 RepID=A0A7J7LQ46_9MAGN|nr:hypothetical protein GIB67_006160 [Kingdonia uniflora]